MVPILFFSNRCAQAGTVIRHLDVMREVYFHHMEALVAGNLRSFCGKP